MRSAQRGAEFIGWLAILWLSILFTVTMAAGQVRVGHRRIRIPDHAMEGVGGTWGEGGRHHDRQPRQRRRRKLLFER